MLHAFIFKVTGIVNIIHHVSTLVLVRPSRKCMLYKIPGRNPLRNVYMVLLHDSRITVLYATIT